MTVEVEVERDVVVISGLRCSEGVAPPERAKLAEAALRSLQPVGV